MDTPMATTKLMTADELLELEGEGHRYELMAGALVAMAPTNEEHAAITVTLAIEIGGYVRRHNIGRAVSGNPGLRISRDPDPCSRPTSPSPDGNA